MKTYAPILFIPAIFWAVIYFTYTHAWKLDDLDPYKRCEEIYHLAVTFSDIRNHGLIPSVKTNRMLTPFEQDVLHEVDRRVVELMHLKQSKPEKYAGMLENPNAIGLQIYDECLIDAGIYE
jgi:hypothetical protein